MSNGSQHKNQNPQGNCLIYTSIYKSESGTLNKDTEEIEMQFLVWNIENFRTDRLNKDRGYGNG